MDVLLYPSAGLFLMCLVLGAIYNFVSSRSWAKGVILWTLVSAWIAFSVVVPVWASVIQWEKRCYFCVAFGMLVVLPIMLLPPFLFLNDRFRWFPRFR